MTIASSTTNPVPMVSAISERLSSENPQAHITPNVAINDSGRATPAMTVALDPEALALYGLKSQDVLEVIHSAFAGATVGQTYAGTRKVDVVLILPEEMRHRIEQVGTLMVASPLGPVPLRSVAKIAPSEGRFTIHHEQGERRVTVTFNEIGRAHV